MLIAVCAILGGACGILIGFIIRYRRESLNFREKCRSLENAAALSKQEAFRLGEKCKTAENEATLVKDKYKDLVNLEGAKRHLELQVASLQREEEKVEAEYRDKRGILERLVHEVGLYESEADIVSYGLYKPQFDFENSEGYTIRLAETREKQKAMVRDGTAAKCSENWTVNGSLSEGKKQTKNYMKLMLRGFNGECDALVANVRWHNISRQEERLSKAYEAINKLGSTHTTEITRAYYYLKQDELHLAYEYAEKLGKEKEQQRRIQEQMREEQRAQREIERALEDAKEDEERYKKALQQAKEELETASGEQVSKLNGRIAQLEARLSETLSKRDKALSLAEVTKAGHVYVISNIGSFGDDVYKIGLTRRFDPMERVRELGGASVPFPFDVHAIIFSENAPELESRLHEAFYESRLNHVNERREFFNVTLEEIARVANESKGDIDFIKFPEAREFRESVANRLLSHQKGGGEEKEELVLKNFPKNL